MIVNGAGIDLGLFWTVGAIRKLMHFGLLEPENLDEREFEEVWQSNMLDAWEELDERRREMFKAEPGFVLAAVIKAFGDKLATHREQLTDIAAMVQVFGQKREQLLSMCLASKMKELGEDEE